MSYIAAHNTTLRGMLATNFFVAELLHSRFTAAYQLWLISPWITNFTLSMPNGGLLSDLVDSAEYRPNLFEVVRQIALNGGEVKIVIRPETSASRHHFFVAPVLNLAAAYPRITVRAHTELHAKIYAGQYGALVGSLNLTESGIERNLEFGAYYSDARNIARLQAEARSLFESAQEIS